ncbi:MAG: hypothetical protein P9F19_02685 [Candidatus Contendobacter sp.]|nr:hypothetical protein [Candidatus Contendobacter sp.]
MNLETIQKNFSLYLDKFWKLSDIAPFLLAYIRLLLLFKNELSRTELNVVLERQKQLHGEKFKDEDFDDLRNSSRKEIDRDLGNNTSTMREAMLNRLLFCALLDTEENDFFYLTEPMFEFVQKMEISSDQLKQILESEFVGFKIPD